MPSQSGADPLYLREKKSTGWSAEAVLLHQAPVVSQSSNQKAHGALLALSLNKPEFQFCDLRDHIMILQVEADGGQTTSFTEKEC